MEAEEIYWLGEALRLVDFYDEEHKRSYQFITNLLDAKAEDIVQYYKKRWDVELLFKWLKQNLKLTKFLAENENAIKIQIYIAIIAYVLIGMFKKLCRSRFSRTIDLLSWIKIVIFSSHTPLEPPTKLNKINTNQLLLFKEI